MSPIIVLGALAFSPSPLHRTVVAHHRRATAIHATDSDRCGLLVVGLAGNNGVTLLAGQIANKNGLAWESAREPMVANLLGCITQVGSLSEMFSFAPFDDVAVGGWDVRPTPLGDALYESRILDYDLVRQVRGDMDEMAVMPGVWDADFYGESQREGATQIVEDVTRSAQLERLREDIRRFKEENEVGGHTTVVWSASVERPLEEYATADELLGAIDADDREVSPSLLYAAAAVLEGCSFVNGGSQNTVQPCLLELASRATPSVYVLGTDFKAGQTKVLLEGLESAWRLPGSFG